MKQANSADSSSSPPLSIVMKPRKRKTKSKKKIIVRRTKGHEIQQSPSVHQLYDDSVRIEAANNITVDHDQMQWQDEGNISSDSEQKGKLTPMVSYHK